MRRTNIDGVLMQVGEDDLAEIEKRGTSYVGSLMSRSDAREFTRGEVRGVISARAFLEHQDKYQTGTRFVRVVVSVNDFSWRRQFFPVSVSALFDLTDGRRVAE